ncbi:MAG TPA: hypothetical protein VIA62_19340 [Thermoanaerobaculia bacterium]|jgi:hypothetical protein|nr:hypothetical protein [Thermoanaerobaculia bacterium]
MFKRWLVGAAVVLPLLVWAGTVAYGAKTGVRAAGVITLPPPGTAPVFPADISGGAPQASLQQAAAFAWQEFIALTWPAQPGGQAGQYNRDTPDPKGIYGRQAAASGPPLVWETFRHKVEIFPGTAPTAPYLPNGKPNPAYDYSKNTPPHGATQGAPDFGYNEPPQYDYAPGNVTGPCNPSDPANATTAWVNLDENSQIFLDTMYAGVTGPAAGAQPSPSQEILFLAKANKVDYTYVVNPANAGGTQLYQGYWNHSFTGGATTDNPQYNTAIMNFDTYQGNVLKGQQPTLVAPYVSLPPGTVEVKSAWRPLTPTEAQSGKFHTAMVRFYQPSGNAACYRQAVWGMLALHIIQKTPSAPYFIYATFSQADNILISVHNKAVSVEDVDGRQVIQNPGPNLDTGYSNPAQNPVQATLATMANPNTETFNVTTTQCKPGVRLYLQNTKSPTPQGNTCVNQRTHRIPQAIVNVNQAAHNAIRAYNQGNNGGKPTPWLYYKLVNVQAAPIDKPVPGTIYTGANAATYYQSNEVVETNYNLQFFSGRLVSSSPSNGSLMSDFNPDGSVFKNTFYLKRPTGSPVTTYNMGGCMGCHGNAQQAGDDFSFILNVGRNDAPETLPVAVHPVLAADKVKKYRLPG